MDLGSGSTYESNMASVSSGGFSNPSGFGNNGGGVDNNDPYQGFVQASQPRGLSALERAVQNTVQQTKNYLSQPANKRGIIGSLIGGALFGPFGAFLGGSLGQRYGGGAQRSVTDFFTGENPDVYLDPNVEQEMPFIPNIQRTEGIAQLYNANPFYDPFTNTDTLNLMP